MRAVTESDVERACEAYEGFADWEFQTEEVKANTRVSMRRALESLIREQQLEADTCKQQWDTLAAMLGADGDNVDEVYNRAMTILLAANSVAVLTNTSIDNLEALVPPDAAYFEKLRTLQDARNYRYIRDAFDRMKTSESERFMECLRLEGDAWLPLDTLLFGARAAP